MADSFFSTHPTIKAGAHSDAADFVFEVLVRMPNECTECSGDLDTVGRCTDCGELHCPYCGDHERDECSHMIALYSANFGGWAHPIFGDNFELPETVTRKQFADAFLGFGIDVEPIFESIGNYDYLPEDELQIFPLPDWYDLAVYSGDPTMMGADYWTTYWAADPSSKQQKIAAFERDLRVRLGSLIRRFPRTNGTPLRARAELD